MMHGRLPEGARTFRILVAFAIAALLVVVPQIAQATWQNRTDPVTLTVGTLKLQAPALIESGTSVKCPTADSPGEATIAFQAVPRAEGYTTTLSPSDVPMTTSTASTSPITVVVPLPAAAAGSWTVAVVANVHSWTSPRLEYPIICPAP